MTPAVALVTGLVFALANAAHCAGMCGAFALRAAGGARRGPNFGLYGLGKTFTYVFLGSLAGWFGKTVVGFGGHAQTVLGLAVGSLLLLSGIRLLRRQQAGAGSDAAGRLFGPLLSSAGSGDLPGGTFTLGALTGALPCGAVYAAALQAAATGSVTSAMTLMCGFAVGTLPSLGLVGFVGSVVARRFPATRLRVAAASLVLLMSAVTLVRAILPLVQEGRACCH